MRLNELLMTVVEDAQFEGVEKSITVDYQHICKISENLTILAQ